MYTSLVVTRFCFSLSAYLRVFTEWSAELDPGQTQAITITLVLNFLWMKLSHRERVSLLALKGM